MKSAIKIFGYSVFFPSMFVIVVLFFSYGFHPSNKTKTEEIEYHKQVVTVDQKLNSIERYIKESK